MEHRFYLGIDLDDQYAVISSYELNKKEPETFSAIAGSEIYPVSYTHLDVYKRQVRGVLQAWKDMDHRRCQARHG